MKSRILVCGGRNYYDRVVFNNAMGHALQWFGFTYCIIEGDATGADALAKEWGRSQGVPVITMAANWTMYSKTAGSVRNSCMLEWAKPDLIIAFPGGAGTANMVRIAKEAGVDVWCP